MFKLFAQATLFVFLLLLCGQTNAQNKADSLSDSTLNRFLLTYTPKDTVNNRTFLLKFYKGNELLAQFKLLKINNRKIVIDTFVYEEPYTQDSLLTGSGIKRADLVYTSNWETDTPVVKSVLIMPPAPQVKVTKADTFDLLKVLKAENKIGITYTNEVEYGNNFYYGLANTVNPRVTNSITADAKILGLPITIGTTYTNFRTDNSLNLSDFRVSMDVLSFKNDLYNKNLITSKQLEKMNADQLNTKAEISNLDSNINGLENKLNNPYNLEKYKENKHLQELSKKDTSVEGRIKLSQLKNQTAQYETEQAQLEKLKKLRNLKKRELGNIDKSLLNEKSNLLSSKNIRKNMRGNSTLGKGFSLLYAINKLDIGRIAPIYSEFTLNGLTYLGLNTQFNISNTEISLTAGRLNNYASYLYHTSDNLGGYIYAGKISQKQVSGNTFLSVLYLNPNTSNAEQRADNRYLVLGIGGKEELIENVHFSWELAYAESDSNNRTYQKSNQLFQRFDPYALAGGVGLAGDIDAKTKFEINSKYVGYDFKNPANFNLRNDFLRNSLKITRLFNQSKIQVSYQLKYDADNFTALKSSTTHIINNNVLFSYRMHKQFKTIVNVNYTQVSNYFEGAQFGLKQYVFTSQMANITLIHTYKNKTVQGLNTMNLNFNRINNEAVYTSSNFLHQVSYTNLLDFYRKGFKINSAAGYQAAQSDSVVTMNASVEGSKLWKSFEFGLGGLVKINNNLLSYKSITSRITYTKNRFRFMMGFEYYWLNNTFESQGSINNGLILRTSLTIKI
ncbi:MAG: hypothetical protein V4538_17390 [Bacteroidota bacterium]